MKIFDIFSGNITGSQESCRKWLFAFIFTMDSKLGGNCHSDIGIYYSCGGPDRKFCTCKKYHNKVIMQLANSLMQNHLTLFNTRHRPQDHTTFCILHVFRILTRWWDCLRRNILHCNCLEQRKKAFSPSYWPLFFIKTVKYWLKLNQYVYCPFESNQIN